VKDTRDDFDHQYQYDRDWILHQFEAIARNYKEQCDIVTQIRLHYATMWGKLVTVAAIGSVIGGIVGGAIGAAVIWFVKYAPAIQKAAESVPKK